jgi:hypothetical protein
LGDQKIYWTRAAVLWIRDIRYKDDEEIRH